SRECVKSEVKTQPPRTPQIEARHGVAAARRASEGSRSVTASPGCYERWGVWGAISGPPISLGGGTQADRDQLEQATVHAQLGDMEGLGQPLGAAAVQRAVR